MENEEYKLIYEINDKNNTIRILSKEFVKNNKNKGRIVYRNKKYLFKEFFELKNIKIDKLKLGMILIEGHCNKSSMFKDCSSLIQIKYDNIIYNREDILFRDKKYLYFIFYQEKEICNYYIDYNKNINEESDFLKLTNLLLNQTFYNCPPLTLLKGLLKWYNKDVIEENHIFSTCKSILFIPDYSISDANNNCDIENKFYNCFNLPFLPDISNSNNNIKIKVFSYKNYEMMKKKNANFYLSFLTEKSCSIFNLIYEIKEEKIIKLFSPYFVRQNKTKCKLIINNKLSILTDKYQIFDDNMKILKIKLIIFNEKAIDLSYMFYDCKSLKKFYLISKEDNKVEEKYKEEQNNKTTEDIDTYDFDFNELNNQKSAQLYNSNETKKNSKGIILDKNIYKSYNYKNKFHLIYYYSEKNNISDNEREKMEKILIKSYNFLTPSSSLNFFILQNNNINEFSSINEDLFQSITTKKIKRSKNTNETYNFYKNLCSFSIFSNNYPNNKNIAPTDLSYMFYGCSSLISIFGISNWNTNLVTNMSHMFEKCSLLKNIGDISQWKFKKLNDINQLFKECSSLESLPDISNWNINNVQNMNGVFHNCSSLKALPDISKWNTENVLRMGGIFSECSSLILLPDISKWNIHNV